MTIGRGGYGLGFAEACQGLHGAESRAAVPHRPCRTTHFGHRFPSSDYGVPGRVQLTPHANRCTDMRGPVRPQLALLDRGTVPSPMAPLPTSLSPRGGWFPELLGMGRYANRAGSRPRNCNVIFGAFRRLGREPGVSVSSRFVGFRVQGSGVRVLGF